MTKKVSELMHGDPKFGKNLRSGYFLADRRKEELRIRLGLPIGCGLSYTDMVVLDAVTSKALAANS